MSTSFAKDSPRAYQAPAIEARLTARSSRTRPEQLSGSAARESRRWWTPATAPPRSVVAKRYRAEMLAATLLPAVTSKSVRQRRPLRTRRRRARRQGTALELPFQSYLLILDDCDRTGERGAAGRTVGAHIHLAKELGGDSQGCLRSDARRGGPPSRDLAIDCLTKLDAAPERKVRAIQFFTPPSTKTCGGGTGSWTLSLPTPTSRCSTRSRPGAYTVRGPVPARRHPRRGKPG